MKTLLRTINLINPPFIKKKKMNELGELLLQQSPLIIALGVGIWHFTKEIKIKDKIINDKCKEIARVNAANIDIVKNNTKAMTKMLTLFNEIRNDIKDFKNDS